VLLRLIRRRGLLHLEMPDARGPGNESFRTEGLDVSSAPIACGIRVMNRDDPFRNADPFGEHSQSHQMVVEFLIGKADEDYDSASRMVKYTHARRRTRSRMHNRRIFKEIFLQPLLYYPRGKKSPVATAARDRGRHVT
jgi:hypothetical protein